jgi:hypothetical protein
MDVTRYGDDEFVGQSDAIKRLGLTGEGLRYRLQRIGAVTYADPVDNRRRLIRRRDLDTLLRPRPIQRKESAAAA